MKHTVFYKDSVGRKNQTKTFGKDEVEVKKKFETLYPNCTIINIEKN